VVLRRYAAYPLPALKDIGPAAAASEHHRPNQPRQAFTLVSFRQVSPFQPK